MSAHVAQMGLVEILRWWGCLPYEEMVDGPAAAVDAGMDLVKDESGSVLIKTAYNATLNAPGATETDLMRVVLP